MNSLCLFPCLPRKTKIPLVCGRCRQYSWSKNRKYLFCVWINLIRFANIAITINNKMTIILWVLLSNIWNAYLFAKDISHLVVRCVDERLWLMISFFLFIHKYRITIIFIFIEIICHFSIFRSTKNLNFIQMSERYMLYLYERTMNHWDSVTESNTWISCIKYGWIKCGSKSSDYHPFSSQ